MGAKAAGGAAQGGAARGPLGHRRRSPAFPPVPVAAGAGCCCAGGVGGAGPPPPGKCLTSRPGPRWPLRACSGSPLLRPALHCPAAPRTTGAGLPAPTRRRCPSGRPRSRRAPAPAALPKGHLCYPVCLRGLVRWGARFRGGPRSSGCSCLWPGGFCRSAGSWPSSLGGVGGDFFSSVTEIRREARLASRRVCPCRRGAFLLTLHPSHLRFIQERAGPGTRELPIMGKGSLYFELLLEHTRLAHVGKDRSNSFARKVNAALDFSVILGVSNLV